MGDGWPCEASDIHKRYLDSRHNDVAPRTKSEECFGHFLSRNRQGNAILFLIECLVHRTDSYQISVFSSSNIVGDHNSELESNIPRLNSAIMACSLSRNSQRAISVKVSFMSCTPGTFWTLNLDRQTINESSMTVVPLSTLMKVSRSFSGR